MNTIILLRHLRALSAGVLLSLTAFLTSLVATAIDSGLTTP